MPIPVASLSRKSAQPLQAHLAPVLQNLLARRGFRDARLFAAWPEIMGEALSPYSAPDCIRAHPDGKTLYIKAHSTIALQLQYLAPQILARIHRLYGTRDITRLAFSQGRITPPRARKRRTDAPPLAPKPKTLAQALARLRTACKHQ